MPENNQHQCVTPNPETSKNLVICCDGTGNQFGSKLKKHKDGTLKPENNNSNVVRLYTCLHVGKRQLVYYHPGVGTMGAPNSTSAVERWWSKVEGLAFGAGFMDNVADAYRFLMQNYADGDHIYMFGFSRGAYTVRALAGALSMYGLLCPGNEGHLNYLLSMYAASSKKAAKQNRDGGRRLVATDESDAFRETFCRDVSIHFMGVWDTVSSVGWIWDPVKLLHDGQNPIIRKARHAISVDERRCFFQAMPWAGPMHMHDPKLQAEDREKLANALKQSDWQMQDIVQAWFPGVHSDIGGSYCLDESGPALQTFKWMLNEVDPTPPVEDGPLPDGLQIISGKKNAVLGEPSTFRVLHKWHSKPPEVDSKFHKSLRRFWWILEVFPHKYFDYTGKRRWQVEPWPHDREIPQHSLMHPEVRRRLQLSEKPHCPPQHRYTPRNLKLDNLVKLTASNGPELHQQAREDLLKQEFDIFHPVSPQTIADESRELPKVVAAACLLVGAALVFARRT